MKTATAPETNTIHEVDPVICHPNPWNKSREVDDEFMDSIRADGQLVPALLRPHPTEEGHYEIACGERRKWTCEALEIPLRAEIRPLTDEQVRRFCLIENDKRKDFSPQQVAQLLREMTNEHGDDEALIAAGLGWTVQDVRRRARLLELSPGWLEALGGGTFPKWTMRHWDRLTGFPAEEQEALYNNLPLALADEWSLSDLDAWLGDHTHLLASAPWDLEDESLEPKAGSCAACPARTCQQNLLGDVEALKNSDRCPSGVCWDRKRAAYLERERAREEQKHGQVIQITKDADMSDAVQPGDYEPAKKSDPGAVRAQVVGDRGLGKFEWVKLSNGGGAETEEPEEEEREDERKRFEQRQWALAAEKLGDALPSEAKILPLSRMVPLALVFGVQIPLVRMQSPWEELKRIEGWNTRVLLRELFEQVGVKVVSHLNAIDASVAEEHVKKVAKLFSLDWKKFKKEADEDLPMPARLGGEKKASKRKSKAADEMPEE